MSPSGPVRVVVVDDHPMFRLGLSALLSSLDGIESVGDAADADAALDLVARLAPDVVIMDLDLGETSGIDATAVLTARHPEVAILVVTMFDDEASVLATLRAGARGYLLKSSPPAAIERAVRAVAQGEVLFGPDVAERALRLLRGGRRTARPFPDLTERESEVLEEVARGHDNTTIARRLHRSPKTVRNHVSNILTKLQVPDRARAIVAARRAGLGIDGDLDDRGHDRGGDEPRRG